MESTLSSLLEINDKIIPQIYAKKVHQQLESFHEAFADEVDMSYLTIQEIQDQFINQEFAPMLRQIVDYSIIQLQYLMIRLKMFRKSTIVRKHSLYPQYMDQLRSFDMRLILPFNYRYYTNLAGDNAHCALSAKIRDIYKYIYTIFQINTDISSSFTEQDYMDFKNGLVNLKSDKQYMMDCYKLFRNDGAYIEAGKSFSSDIVKNALYIIYENGPQSITLTLYDIAQYIRVLQDFRNYNFTVPNDKTHISSAQFSKIKNDMYDLLLKIHTLTNRYVIRIASQVDAIIEMLEVQHAVLVEAINLIEAKEQVENSTLYDYDVPDDSQEDYEDLAEEYQIESDMVATFASFDEVYRAQASGLMYLNEGLKETITKYFQKIIDQAQNVLEKAQRQITDRMAEQLKNHEEDIRSPQKPDPDFRIKKYTKYKMDILERTHPVPFDFAAMRDDLKNREAFLQKYYADLYDKEEKNLFKVMYNKCKNGVEENLQVTTELIDDCLLYCTKGYKDFLDETAEFKKAIETAKKAAESVAVATPTEVQPATTPTNTATTPTTTKESTDVVNEADTKPMITPAADAQKAAIRPVAGNPNKNKESDTVSFDDNEKKDTRQGDTELMKASTQYCGITAGILSAKIRTIYKIFNVRFKIISHYMMRNGWGPTKKEKPTEEQQQERNNEV